MSELDSLYTKNILPTSVPPDGWRWEVIRTYPNDNHRYVDPTNRIVANIAEYKNNYSSYFSAEIYEKSTSIATHYGRYTDLDSAKKAIMDYMDNLLPDLALKCGDFNLIKEIRKEIRAEQERRVENYRKKDLEV